VTKTHILEVTLRLAVTAESREKSEEVVKEIFSEMANDGSLGDMFCYEWDNPSWVGCEDE
jgi:hypothetical protein